MTSPPLTATAFETVAWAPSATVTMYGRSPTVLAVLEGLAESEELAEELADELGDGDAESLEPGDGVALAEADALLLPEPPGSVGMSADALVAHAVAASTAAMVEQARSARPWGEGIYLLDHSFPPRTNIGIRPR